MAPQEMTAGLASLTTGTDHGKEQPRRNQTLACLANATGGQASVTSARSSTVKPGEEEDVWSVEEIEMDLTVKFVSQIITSHRSKIH